MTVVSPRFEAEITSPDAVKSPTVVTVTDPVVDVATCEQAGVCGVPRRERRVVNLGRMATAKQIAEYVALSRLGFDATLNDGPVQIDGFDPSLCPDDAPAQQACIALDIGDTIVAIDGEPVRLFFLIVGPDASAGLHVKLLSRIARLVRRDQG